MRARCLIFAALALVSLPGPAWTQNRAPKAWLGFGYTLQNFDSKSPVRQWLYVVKIAPVSPALASGLQLQDAIVAINGKPVRFASAAVALDHFASIAPGTALRFDVLRGGKRIVVHMRAKPLPKDYAAHWERNKALAEEVDSTTKSRSGSRHRRQ